MSFFENHPEDFIPAIAQVSFDTPDYLSVREAPRSVYVPDGRPTVAFDTETGAIDVRFNRHSINDNFIRRSINQVATEHGPDAVREIRLWVSDETMAQEGAWLVANRYDRVIEANPKTGLFCWNRQLRLKRKVRGETSVV